MMDLHSSHVFRVKKVDNSADFAAGGISCHRTHHNSLCRDKDEHLSDQLCDGLQGNESCETTLHVQALLCSYISCLK
jgi:hypothetical protein